MTCSTCKDIYHPECVNKDYRSLTKSSISSWICPSCQCKVPKTDNSNTPVRPQAGSGTDTSKANVTLRPQNRDSEKRPQSRTPSSDTDALVALTREIKLLRDDVVEVKNHLKDLTSCVQNCVARLDEYDARIACSDAKIRALEERELENALLHQKVGDLEERLRTQAQNMVRNEIEIQGINEHASENLFHIIKVAATKIGVELADSDVDDVSRAGPRRGAGTQGSQPSLPRPVVLRFVRHMKRQEFLKAAKSRYNITTADMEIEGQKNKVFFNERLTKENRLLFRQARQQKSTQGYKYCWTSNGRIFIRKREGGPVIAVRTTADLERTRESDYAIRHATPAAPAPADPGSVLGGLSAASDPSASTFRDDC